MKSLCGLENLQVDVHSLECRKSHTIGADPFLSGSFTKPTNPHGRVTGRDLETFELHQLKSAPSSQLLPVFPGFDRLQTCCHSFGPAGILHYFQVPTNFFFVVMTTGQELGHR
jgi:hypothetical protein